MASSLNIVFDSVTLLRLPGSDCFGDSGGQAGGSESMSIAAVAGCQIGLALGVRPILSSAIL
jgi:hypothetical protein